MFEVALLSLPEDHRTAVLDCLHVWCSKDGWVQVASNVQAETALPERVFARLLESFALALGDSAHSPELAWIDACREEGHKLAGAELSSRPDVLGRATTLDHHATVVSDTCGVALTPDQCKGLLRRVTQEGEAARSRDVRILRRAALGQHLVWATFCEDAPHESPFQHVDRTARTLRSSLGLGHCPEGESLLLLSYGTPPVPLHRPTVADAEDNPWYRPRPEAEAPWGMTCPLDADLPQAAPRPEVVHRAVPATTIRLPLLLAV